MQLFYHTDISEEVSLEANESQHCIKVLRHREGDPIQLIDGKGKLFQGIISLPDPKRCGVSGIKLLKAEDPPYQLHIAIAPTKNADRMEWFVEKVTEIGATEITFIACEHSERARINLDRIHRKILSALKQSNRLWLPRVNPLTPLSQWIDHPMEKNRFIAYADQQGTPLKDILPRKESSLILIGPEGDFSPVEIQQAENLGYRKVSLGKNVLRTETAGLVAVSLLASSHH